VREEEAEDAEKGEKSGERVYTISDCYGFFAIFSYPGDGHVSRGV